MRKVRTAASLSGVTSDPPCADVRLSRPTDSTPEQSQTGDPEDAEAAEIDPEDPRSARGHLCTELGSLNMLAAASAPNGATSCLPRHPGITGGLMKGALSVAASAYKALFTGQGPAQVSSRALFVLCRFSQSSPHHVFLQPPVDASAQDTMMAVLVEMGFGDRPLNQRLLNKYNYNLLDVVNELVQMSDNDWYSTRY